MDVWLIVLVGLVIIGITVLVDTAHEHALRASAERWARDGADFEIKVASNATELLEKKTLRLDVKLRLPFNGGHRAPHGKGSIIIGADRCPLCGCGNACYSEQQPTRPTAIYCEDCGAFTPECPDRSTAVRTWNDGIVTMPGAVTLPEHLH